MLNFTELKNQVAKLAQRSGDSDFISLIGDWVNLGHNFLANSYDFFPELEDEHDFTTANTTESYIMPQRFDKPLKVFDITNDVELKPLTRQEYFASNIAAVADADTVKVPQFYSMFRTSPVDTQVSTSGDTVRVKSSSASDTSVTVRVEGYLDSAQTVIGYEDIIASGTTPVNGSTTFYEITHFSKAKDTIGFITLTNSTPSDLAVLGPTERVSRRKMMFLGKIPNQANSMRVLFKMKPRKLVDDNDYPFIDADEYFINVAYGYALAQEKETVDRANIIWSKAEEVRGSILANVVGRMGEEFQHKITTDLMRAHQVR